MIDEPGTVLRDFKRLLHDAFRYTVSLEPTSCSMPL
jgi:hypothetical protein